MMRKASPPSGGGMPFRSSHVDGMRHQGQPTDDAARNGGETFETKPRNAKGLPSPPSLLKSPPPTVVSPSFPLMPFASIQEDASFVDTFDEEFIRQQEEILSIIQSHQQQQLPDEHMHRQKERSQTSYLEQTVESWPTKNRGSKGNVYSRSGSNYSHDSGTSSGSHHTGTTATCSTQPSSNNNASVVSTPQSTKSDSDHRLYSFPKESRSQADFEVDVSVHLHDVDLIREQQRILDQFQRSKQPVLLRNAEDDRTAPSTSLQCYINHTMDQIEQQTVHFAETSMFTGSSTSAQGRKKTSVSQSHLPQDQSVEHERQQGYHQAALPSFASSSPAGNASSRQRRHDHGGNDGDLQNKLQEASGGKYEKSSLSTSTARSCHVVNDQVFQVGNKNLRVRGTRKAYDAIANGRAMIVQCATCRAILQVAMSAKLLYCSLCGNVTPVTLAQEQPVLDPHYPRRGGGGSDDLDTRISRTIQQQEEDVAYARKLAKMSR
jgi:hypothetical protein